MTLDETGRLAGRGAYLCRDATCWRLGVERSFIRRALAVDLGDEIRAVLMAGPPGSTEADPMKAGATGPGPADTSPIEASAPETSRTTTQQTRTNTAR